MDFLSDAVVDGVRERRLTVGDAPGMLFSPSAGRPPGPLVLLAHGGGQHAAHPAVLSRARRYVDSYGFTVAALDAPGHAARSRSAQLDASLAALRAAVAGSSPAAAVAKLNADIAADAVPEWRSLLDALDASGLASPSVGFVGFSLGAGIGVPLVASEPRINAAVLGLVGQHGLTDGAARITVPVQLVVQWDDELVAREDALALFTAIGSREKRLHINPGGHADVPASERESAERFLYDHLGDREVAAGRPGSASAAREDDGQARLGRGIVLRSEEDACEVLIEGRPTWARYARAFPTPRVERVSPGHLVALTTAADDTPVVMFAGMTPLCSAQPATKSECGSPPTARSSPCRAIASKAGTQGPGPISRPDYPEPTGGSPATSLMQPSGPTWSLARSNAFAPSTTCGTHPPDRDRPGSSGA